MFFKNLASKYKTYISGALIALIFLLWAAGSETVSQDAPPGYQLKYGIKVNDHDKGTLSMIVLPSYFTSKYHGITNADQIPFFARSKSGRWDNGLFSSEFSFNGHKYDVYNDLAKAPDTVLEEVRGDATKRAAIVDIKDGLPRLIFDKIPAVVFENLLIGFLENTIEPGKDMLLFEDSGRSILRIFMEIAQDQIPLKVQNRDCSTREYVCKRQVGAGREAKSIFKIFVTPKGIPVRVASLSGRWEMDIADYRVQDKMTRYPLKDMFDEIAKDEVRRLIERSAFSVDVEMVKHTADSYTYTYKTEIHLPLPSGRELAAAELLLKKYLPGRDSELHQNAAIHVHETHDQYCVSALNTEISKELAHQNRVISSSDASWKTVTDEEVDAKDFLKTILKFSPSLSSCSDSSYRVISPQFQGEPSIYIICENKYGKTLEHLDEEAYFYVKADKGLHYLYDIKPLSMSRSIVKNVLIDKKSRNPKKIILAYKYFPRNDSPEKKFELAAEVVAEKLIGRRDLLPGEIARIKNALKPQGGQYSFLLCVPAELLADYDRNYLDDTCKDIKDRVNANTYRLIRNKCILEGESNILLKNIPSLVQSALENKKPLIAREIKEGRVIWEDDAFLVMQKPKEVDVCK